MLCCVFFFLLIVGLLCLAKNLMIVPWDISNHAISLRKRPWNQLKKQSLSNIDPTKKLNMNPTQMWMYIHDWKLSPQVGDLDLLCKFDISPRSCCGATRNRGSCTKHVSAHNPTWINATHKLVPHILAPQVWYYPIRPLAQQSHGPLFDAFSLVAHGCALCK